MLKIVSCCPRHPVAVIALMALCVTFPLFVYIKPSLDDSDLLFYKIILKEFSRQLGQRELYPRWLYNANDGFGSPVFLFYAPGAFYITSLLQALHGIDPDGSIRFILSMNAAHMLAGWLAYLWLRKHCEAAQALVIALLYVSIPYGLHILYIQTALSVEWALAGTALVFICLDLLMARRAFALAALSFANAFLILTHLPTFVTFAWMPFLYVLFLAPPAQKMASIARLIVADMLAAELAAIYLAPLWLNREFVQVTAGFMQGDLDFSSNFLRSNEWFCLPYFIVAVFAFFALRRQSAFPVAGTFRGFLFAAVAIVLFLLLPLSLPLWRMLPPLQYLQFPFRFLNVALLPLACFAGFLMREKRYRLAVLIIWLAGSLYYGILIVTSAPYDNAPVLSKITAYELIAPPEYLTRWNADKGIRNAILAGQYEKQPVAAVREGKGTITTLDSPSEKLRVAAEISQPSTLVFRRFYFPGAEVEDLKTHTLLAAMPGSPEGFLTVSLPPGSYRLEARFSAFRGEREGGWISLAALMGTLLAAGLDRPGTRYRLSR